MGVVPLYTLMVSAGSGSPGVQGWVQPADTHWVQLSLGYSCRVGPDISVAVATFNGERFIEEQLASIASQHPAPFEVVIADDGSTDRTRELVASALSDVPFRVLFLGHGHVGLRRNVERAIEACTGSIIALSDQDDIWLPGRLAAIGGAFADPTVNLWFSDAELIDERGGLLGVRLWERVTLPPEAQRALTEGAGVRRLLFGMTVTGATMAFRTSLRSLALPFPAELDDPDTFLHDGWIAVLAALTGRVATETHCFTQYRRHERQFTHMPVAPEPAHTSRRRELATRRNIEREHARVHLVLERLVERDTLNRCSKEDQRLLTELDELLGGRIQPPGPRRTCAILSAFGGGLYDRHARGWRTALGDLFYPRR